MTDKEKIELLDEFLELIPNKPNNYDLGESIRSIFIKRIGYSKETIEALRSAYRSIYRKKLTVDEAVKDLDSLRKDFKEVNIFLSSIEDSTRGISR